MRTWNMPGVSGSSSSGFRLYLAIHDIVYQWTTYYPNSQLPIPNSQSSATLLRIANGRIENWKFGMNWELGIGSWELGWELLGAWRFAQRARDPPDGTAIDAHDRPDDVVAGSE